MISSESVDWIGTCVGLDADDLHDFDESSKQISYRKFRAIVGAEVVKELNKDFTVKISTDWHIRFETGVFCGAPAVCMHHSGFHYLWRINSDEQPYHYEKFGNRYTIIKGHTADFGFTYERDNAILICRALNGLTSIRRPNTKIVQS